MTFVALTEPVDNPHVVFAVAVKVAVMVEAEPTVICFACEQPEPSVTVTVYIPAARFEMLAVVAPLLHL